MFFDVEHFILFLLLKGLIGGIFYKSVSFLSV